MIETPFETFDLTLGLLDRALDVAILLDLDGRRDLFLCERRLSTGQTGQHRDREETN
jgi:hypothetical protein